MSDDDWDLADDGEINSDPEDITLKPKVLPKFRLVSKKHPKNLQKNVLPHHLIQHSNALILQKNGK